MFEKGKQFLPLIKHPPYVTHIVNTCWTINCQVPRISIINIFREKSDIIMIIDLLFTINLTFKIDNTKNVLRINIRENRIGNKESTIQRRTALGRRYRKKRNKTKTKNTRQHLKR